jgi:hypothetical protein
LSCWLSQLSLPGRWRWPGSGSLIEIGASTVVIWELSGTGAERQRRGLRLIGSAFAALAVFLLVQSTVVLAAGYHPRHSVPGITWAAATAVVMFALATGKARTGRARTAQRCPIARQRAPHTHSRALATARSYASASSWPPVRAART